MSHRVGTDGPVVTVFTPACFIAPPVTGVVASPVLGEPVMAAATIGLLAG